MSSYGLRVWNNFAIPTLLIDQDFVTFARTVSGTSGSFTGNNTTDGSGDIDITLIGNEDDYPLVFVRPNLTWSGINALSGSQQATVGVNNSNSVGTVWNLMPQWNGTLDYVAFERIDILEKLGGYGLEVYKANGIDLAFSSNYRIARIIKHGTGIITWSGLTASNNVPYRMINGHGLNYNSPYDNGDPQTPGENEFSGPEWSVSGSTGYCGQGVSVLTHSNTTVLDFSTDPTLQIVINDGA